MHAVSWTKGRRMTCIHSKARASMAPTSQVPCPLAKLSGPGRWHWLEATRAVTAAARSAPTAPSLYREAPCRTSSATRSCCVSAASDEPPLLLPPPPLSLLGCCRALKGAAKQRRLWAACGAARISQPSRPVAAAGAPCPAGSGGGRQGGSLARPAWQALNAQAILFRAAWSVVAASEASDWLGRATEVGQACEATDCVYYLVKVELPQRAQHTQMIAMRCSTNAMRQAVQHLCTSAPRQVLNALNVSPIGTWWMVAEMVSRTASP